MADFVAPELFCTFILSKEELLLQPVYLCKTCYASYMCCCAGCAKYCHSGHHVNMLTNAGKSYCDCGSNMCKLLIQSNYDLPSSTVKIGNDGTLNTIQQVIPVFETFSIGVLLTNFSILQELQNQCVTIGSMSKDTFWIGLKDTPRCLIEETAKKILIDHLTHLNMMDNEIDKETSGCEWWIQLKHLNEAATNESFSYSTGVDLHYDKDEDMASSFGIGVFPQISTVTYLTEQVNSTPTILLKVTAADEISTTLINQCFVSVPEIGKHIAFDGRLLHGAPSQLAKFSNIINEHDKIPSENPNSTQHQYRITLLVNIWVNYHPLHIKPLDPIILQSINNTAWVFPPTILSPSSNIQSYNISSHIVNQSNGALGEWESIPFINDSTEWGKATDEQDVSLFVWIPHLPFLLEPEKFRKKSKSSNKLETSVTSKEMKPFEKGWKTFELRYVDEESCARLEYDETQSDADDDEVDMIDDFNKSNKII